MLKRILGLVACASVLVAAATPLAEPRIVVVRKTASPEAGLPQRFTGKAVIFSRFEGTKPSNLAAALVSFEPGAHTAWHSHPHGQMLVVTAGCGWVQQEGGERHEIRVGDIVWTPPNVKHWHGAGTKNPMSHMTIHERLDQQDVTWLKKVTAVEYGNAICKE